MKEEKLVQELRSLILANSEELRKIPLNDRLLICFLRARKHDVKRSFNLLQSYYKTKQTYPELMSNLRLKEFNDIINYGYFHYSPKPEQNGSRVMMANFVGSWDPKDCTLEDAFRCQMFLVQMAVADEDMQLNGTVVILDQKNLTIQKIRNINNPGMIRKWAHTMSNVFPIRVRGVHILNEPWIFRMLMHMVLPFVSPKIRSRIFLHGSSLESLHKHVDPACLPEEYGGSNGPIEHMLPNYIPELIETKDQKNMFHCFDIDKNQNQS